MSIQGACPHRELSVWAATAWVRGREQVAQQRAHIALAVIVAAEGNDQVVAPHHGGVAPADRGK